MNIQEMSSMGIRFGLGMAVIPAAVTTIIACSRIIVFNLIVEIALEILTGIPIYLPSHGIIEVPFLWKFSLISAIAGSTIAALSFIVHLANKFFLQYQSTHP